MGKFINKSYTSAIDSLSSGMINKVKSANYTFNNKSPVISDWYNINKQASSIGQISGLHYSDIGKSSPFRFNLIKDAVFYAQGIQIEFNLEYDEDGAVIAPPQISGIVLPNTWIPYQGDHFYIKHVGKDYLYRVTEVDFDTIENGNNVYKFEAQVDQTGKSNVDNQVVETYRMIINNVGTNMSAVVREEVYNTVDSLDSVLSRLKNSYIALFYNDAVQTFTYQGPYGKLYDPYMIEFLIRNNILNGSDEYIYVHHEVPVPRTFSIEYDTTLFRAIEQCKPNKFSTSSCVANPIKNQYSLFSTVVEQYYMIDYNGNGIYKFFPISGELISNVKSNTLFDIESDNAYMNIIIEYMNGQTITEDVLPVLENIKLAPTVDMFYSIPIMIKAIEGSVQNMLS